MIKISQKKEDNSQQSQYSGFIIVSLTKNISSPEINDLVDLAKQKKASRLHSVLKKYRTKITSKPLITSVPPSTIQTLEQKISPKATGTKQKKSLKATASLASFWSIDSRNLSNEETENLVKNLNKLP